MAISTYGNKPAYSAEDPFAGGFGAGSQGILRDAGREGFFNPQGSPAYRATMQRRLLNQGRSRRQRNALLSRLSGMDRMGQRNAMVDADQDIAYDTANAFNDFDANEYAGNRDWFRGMLGQERGFEEERRREREARKAQSGGFWGNLLGAGVGIASSYLPRPK